MKRMREISIACIALMLLLTAVTIPYTLAHTCGDPFTTDLIAGGGNPKSAINVGEVHVWNDCNYLYVKYVPSCSDCLTETHLHVADSLIGIPQTKKNNPIPGHFEYNQPWCGWTYRIANTWAVDEVLYIAAHAVVQGCVRIDDECVCVCETAWGDGLDGLNFNDKNWATYFTYTVQ